MKCPDCEKEMMQFIQQDRYTKIIRTRYICICGVKILYEDGILLISKIGFEENLK